MPTHRLLLAGTTAFALVATPAAAQFMPAPTPTADALAAQMRQLGANPRDVYALIAAGELSTKLGDPAAALGFFGRAQAVEPTNPRIAAGKAGALVLLERPGEALQLYAQAERAGVAMTPYLAQRGLAYDLTGQPGYAQRDYRRALLTARDDETVRRLALSLGNSGRSTEAMALLDPLLRRSDRAAWRARACILAVSGDVAGAQRIAASMMNGGAALSPFFGRLQGLSLADRAFAVHFGQVGPSVARTSDARLAPVMAALPVEPQVAPAPAPVVASVSRETTRRETTRRETRRVKPGREPIAVATAVRMPDAVLPEPPGAQTQVAARDPLPPAAFEGAALPQRQPVPSSIPMQAPVTLASTTQIASSAATPASAPARVNKPAIEIVTLPTRRRQQMVAAAPPPPPPTPSLAPTPTPTPAPVASAPTPVPAPFAVETPPSAPIAVSPQPIVATPAVVAPARTPEVARRNTAMLASIIETIAVPASELDVAPPPSRAPVRKNADSKAIETKRADPKKPDAKKPEAKKPDPAKTEPARWWVQVAGGANAADLGKDWKRLTAKSAAAFRGKSAWTTPLRATNRLLAGPFKAQADASAFVNLLAKDGTSAFAWQSEAGQKIERLGAK